MANDTQTMLAQLMDGATVFDASGEKIGTIKDIDETGGSLHVEKGWLFHKDFYVPLSAVDRVDELGGVYLNLGKHDLEGGYDQPVIPDKTKPTLDMGGFAGDTTNPSLRDRVIAESASEAPAGDVSGTWLSPDKSRWPVDVDSEESER